MSGANAAAIESYNKDQEADIEIRQVKYLNNIVEQDHRAVKRLVRPILGFKSFRSAHVTLTGIELMHMIRKGQLSATLPGSPRLCSVRPMARGGRLCLSALAGSGVPASRATCKNESMWQSERAPTNISSGSTAASTAHLPTTCGDADAGTTVPPSSSRCGLGCSGLSKSPRRRPISTRCSQYRLPSLFHLPDAKRSGAASNIASCFWFHQSVLPSMTSIGCAPGSKFLKQPGVHLHPKRARNRPFRLAIPKRRAGPRTASTNRAVVMFDLIAAPLVGRDPIARRDEDEIVFVVLISPKYAALGAEGTGAAGYRLGPLRHGELGGAAVATSLDCHRPCLRSRGSTNPSLETVGRHATTVTEKLTRWRMDGKGHAFDQQFDQGIRHNLLGNRLIQHVA
jgi:DDE domain